MMLANGQPLFLTQLALNAAFGPVIESGCVYLCTGKISMLAMILRFVLTSVR